MGDGHRKWDSLAEVLVLLAVFGVVFLIVLCGLTGAIANFVQPGEDGRVICGTLVTIVVSRSLK